VLRISADIRRRENSCDLFSLKEAFLDASCGPLCCPTPARALTGKSQIGIIVEIVAERLILFLSLPWKLPKTRETGTVLYVRVTWRIISRATSRVT